MRKGDLSRRSLRRSVPRHRNSKVFPTVQTRRVSYCGYPEAVQRKDAARRAAWYASYVSTLLQRDVRDLAQVDALHTLPNLLKLLAARTAGLLNLADVSRDTGLPHTTVTRYLALLEALFLVHRLPAWSANLGKRLVKAAKLHVGDAGLACHLIGADTARLKQDPSLLRRIVESYVAGELRKQISWTDPQVSGHAARCGQVAQRSPFSTSQTWTHAMFGPVALSSTSF